MTHHNFKQQYQLLQSTDPNHVLFNYSPSNNAPSVLQNGEINYRKKWREVHAVTNMFCSS